MLCEWLIMLCKGLIIIIHYALNVSLWTGWAPHRSCEDEGKARMGVVECINHNLVEPYNVLYEKEGVWSP